MGVTKRAIENDEQWRGWRGDLVGASDTPALFGIHPHKTYFALYHERLGKLQIEQTELMRDGLAMEKVALEKMQRLHPELHAYAPKTHFSDPELGVGATPDIFGVNENGERGPIQVKWVDRDEFRKKWGETPPLWVALQVTQEAWLAGAKWGKICAVVVDHGINLHFYDVDIRQDVIEGIQKEVAEFWRRVRERDEPAPDYRRDGDTIRQVWRQDDGTEIDLSGDNFLPDLLDERESMQATIKNADGRLGAINAELLHKLGPHMIGRFNGGYVSAKTVHRAGYEAKPTSYKSLRVVRDKTNG